MTAVFASVRPRRVPARRPRNFHLLAQMKVTKAKGLNTDLDGMLGCELERSVGHRRTSDRFLADPSSRCDFIERKSLLEHRLTPHEQRGAVLARGIPSPGRSECEPQEIRRREAASKPARKRFDPLGDAKPGALSKQMSGQICIQALCFGDFHFGQQMKVTRPPGRDPAPMWSTVPPRRNPATPR